SAGTASAGTASAGTASAGTASAGTASAGTASAGTAEGSDRPDGAARRLMLITTADEAHNLFYPAGVLTGSQYALLAAGNPVVGRRTTDAGEWLFVCAPLYNAPGIPAGVIETAVDVREINIRNKHDSIIVYEAIVVSVFALMLIMVLSFTNITINIQKVITAINEIKNGNYKARVNYSGNDEVGDLCHNFNYLASLLESKLGVEAVAKAEKAFTAMLSHEIRTPLNAILGLAEIELQNPALQDEIKININKIYTSGYGLLTIINDFLDITKMESGRFDIIDSEYTVADLINSAVEINKVRIKNKPIVFEVAVDPELPASLFGDDTRLRQILNNLLSNAFKYTEKGSVVLTVTWKKKQIRVSKFFGVEAETPPDFNKEGIMEIAVQDTGIGIHRGDIQKIFDKYAQVDLKKNKKIEGTGLGLTITKQLVELMGGTIHIDSIYGEGSTFTVNVPQGICGETLLGKETAEKLAEFSYIAQIGADRNKIKRLPMPYARVLVVDDVETNLDVAKGLLKPYGITVDCVSSGREALEMVKKADSGEIPYYNAIFIDHLMSGLDGLETTKLIRTESGSVYTKTVPIIVMTGNSRDEYSGLFSGSGLTDYLSKPIDINALNDILNIYVCRGDEQAVETPLPQNGENAAGGGTEALYNAAYTKSGGKPANRAGAASVNQYKGDAEWLEGIEIEKGIERFGSLEAYLEIAASFIKSSRALLSSLSAIEHTINGETLDFDTFMINSHGIKGAARGVFAVDVGNEAENIETKSRERDAEYLRHNARHFIERTYKTLENLQKIIETNTIVVQKQRIQHIPPELLEKMGAACQELDIEKIDGITEELKKYEYISEDDKELAEWLIERVKNSDFSDIVRRLP
ncbi:MAG: response regulator, partial [Spirochaetaceae bacterium]|nr:response regulator [Spirochaetaceae bacterium]